MAEPDRSPSPPPVALRHATAQDLPWLQRLATSDSVEPFLSVTTAGRLEDAVARGEVRIALTAGGARAGAVQLVVVNERSRIGDVRMLMVAPDARGAGVAVAVLRALIAEAFGTLGLHRLQAEAYGFNVAALRTFAAAGFTREGVRLRAYDRHGAWQDGVHLGLLADD